MNKKLLLLALICGTILNGLIPSTRADPSNYLGIKVGKTYTFTYVVSPAIRGVTKNIDLPITIKTIGEISTNVTSNVTYQTTYKIEQNGLPVNQQGDYSVIINKTMNLTAYVNNASSPFELFFINSSAKGEKVIVNSTKLGYGTIGWDANGILNDASIATTIDNQSCTISITQKGQGAVPGFSTALISCLLVGTVSLIGIRLVKKAKKGNVIQGLN